MFKNFFSGIRTKVIILVLLISVVIVTVGFISVQSVTRLSTITQEITEGEIPKLRAVQEILSALISIHQHGDVFAAVEAHSGEWEMHKVQFEADIERAHLFLEALTWGSESEAFKAVGDGALYRRWVELGFHEGVTIEKPSPDLAALAGEANLYLAGYESNLRKTFVRLEDLHESDATATATGTQAAVEVEERSGVPETETVEYFESTNATLVRIKDLVTRDVAERVEDAYVDTRQVQIFLISVAALGVLIVLLGSIPFIHLLITRPIRSLTTSVESIATGDLSVRIPETSHDEIGRLAHAFNAMVGTLQASHEDMEKSVQSKTKELSNILKKIEVKNDDLEKSQLATHNLLEDLEEEKEAVEKRVQERTKDIIREKNKLLQVTSNMKGGAILLDSTQTVVFVNEQALSVLGLKTIDTPSEKIMDTFISYFTSETLKEHYERCLKGESFHVPEIEGGGRLYEIYFQFLKNDQNDTEETAGFFILFFDITDAKLLERSKSELVAVASHQLRTPLTAMRGNVEMLVDESYGPLNKDQHELLDDIEVSTVRLITMVNEMLDITKIERGNLEMTLEKLDVKELIDSVLKDLETYATRHKFTVNIKGIEKAAHVEGDKMRVRQIFQNLIDNAIKYSAYPGTLDITTRSKGGFVEIVFKDNGIGIPKNEQAKLFGRFYRASNTAKATSSGSGLGLYIVRSIAQQLGGDIRFESTEGVGTTFTVSLPVHVDHTKK